jgi:segregation and condensation protein B
MPGRPLTYATTPDFLSHFGLADRRDLPGIDDLRAAGLLDPMADDWEMSDNETELESVDESD